ncbi:MAG TPA: Crp/Fnr family transcriptional regulator [Paenibacillus sp.]|uniref:Crp/Fnr family transcriptional regulator n=1 Tax=Paenibacillus sp. TaxID=58172 RepID=UPI0028D8AB98|nr:Crp/Fnr family transcriptional regulator [Paenibacillus sp.]HUC94214.1 Crp/Fnr family transcriptional regulator [Paenibacillus sp.]
MIRRRKSLLAQVPLFKYLTSQELEELSWCAALRDVGRKTLIFAEGDAKDAIFFIVSGLVKTYSAGASGHESNLAFLKKGDALPGEGLFSRSVYAVSASAIVQTQLLVLPFGQLMKFLAANPNAAASMMRMMDEANAALQKQLHDLTWAGSRNPGQLFLLKLAEHYDHPPKGKLRIGIPMTADDFAHTIGSSKELVDRLLHRLHAEGIADMNRSGFVIHDVEALRCWRDQEQV